ncbi:PulJ/GspJ family protein [Pseudidiomarina homiensis]|uniref:PulJ/GspJ family protein n=1 Tax=Pseudidiomarina homiensis TaxID=364198 RepID=UPI00215B214D|nr:prepilin-type N-terminal cleavage/methylation domain-containing protein [Pseudidiomarina homiensis]
MRAHKSIQRGFTLVEIIIVVVLLAVLAIYSFSFLGIGSEIVAQVGSRTQLVAEQRFAVERLNREIRSAVPRSARSNGACLEFMPMLGSNVYLSLPRPGPGGSNPMVVVTPYLSLNTGNLVGSYVLVYATEPSYIYSTDQTRRKTIAAIAVDTPQNGLSTLSLAGSPSEFFTDSPSRTFYFGANPVSWCVDESRNELVRFTNYGLSGTQPGLTTLQSSAGSQQVMAGDVANTLSAGQTPFVVLEPTLQRSNLVRLFFAFVSSEDQSATIDITHEVYIPNVP